MSGMKKALLAGIAAIWANAAPAQDVQYYQLDAVGSVRAVTDANGNVIERHDYLPFGEECTTGPCASNPGAGGGQPRKFTAKERDSETGLDYFGARYYSSRVGRFTTTDPAYTIQENLLDSQRWNKYTYGRNNPLRYVDPDGRDVRLASNLSKSDASFIRNALIAYVRRPGGRAQFETFAADERTITLTAGRLNDENALRQAMRDQKPIAVKFGETSPEGKDVSVTFDVSVHRPEWAGPADLDTGGVVTTGHEFAHVDDFFSGDLQGRYIKGDLPTSATGPAAGRGKEIYRQKPDIGKNEAAAIVDRELKEQK